MKNLELIVPKFKPVPVSIERGTVPVKMSRPQIAKTAEPIPDVGEIDWGKLIVIAAVVGVVGYVYYTHYYLPKQYENCND